MVYMVKIVNSNKSMVKVDVHLVLQHFLTFATCFIIVSKQKIGESIVKRIECSLIEGRNMGFNVAFDVDWMSKML